MAFVFENIEPQPKATSRYIFEEEEIPTKITRHGKFEFIPADLPPVGSDLLAPTIDAIDTMSRGAVDVPEVSLVPTGAEPIRKAGVIEELKTKDVIPPEFGALPVGEPEVPAKALELSFLPVTEILRSSPVTEAELADAPEMLEKKESSILQLVDNAAQGLAKNVFPGGYTAEDAGEALDLSPEFAGQIAQVAVELGVGYLYAGGVIKILGGASEALFTSNWWRRMSIPERRLVIQTVEGMQEAGMSEAQILRSLNKQGRTAEFDKFRTEEIIRRQSVDPTGRAPERPIPEPPVEPVTEPVPPVEPIEPIKAPKAVPEAAPIPEPSVVEKAPEIAPVEAVEGAKTIKLYRAESPSVKFEDVFDSEKLGKFKPPKDVKGKFYTSDQAYADYFRETFGKDATIKTIDVPVEEAKKYEVRPGEYFVPVEAVEPVAAKPEPKAKEPILTPEEIDALVKPIEEVEVIEPVKPKLARKKSEIEKAAEEIEVTTKGAEKEVSVDIPKAEADALTPKEQKAYLIAEIDTVITKEVEATGFSGTLEEAEGIGFNVLGESTGFYKFEVPGDGTFEVTGSMLFDFKKRVKSIFPATFPKPFKLKKFGKPKARKRKVSELNLYNEILSRKKPGDLKPNDVDALLKSATELGDYEGFINYLLEQDLKPETLKKIRRSFLEKDFELEVKKDQLKDAKEELKTTEIDSIRSELEQEIQSLTDEISAKEPTPTPPGKAEKVAKTETFNTKDGFADTGGYATQLKSSMDLPEIVLLAQQLMKGKFPQIIRGFRRHAIKGKFYVAGEGKIKLAADLFKNTDEAAAVLAHEVGHLVDFLPDKDIKRGNILGRIATLKRNFKHTLARGPDMPGELTAKDRSRLRYQAKKQIEAKGTSRWIDEVIRKEFPITPQDVLSIWNTVEGAGLLDKGLIDYIKELNTPQKKAVVKDALKGVVASELQRFAKVIETKTGKKLKVELSEKEIKDLIKKRYADMINEELEKRQLFDRDVITQELKSLTLAWKPFDPLADPKYTQYRYSSVELYADAISALINAPGLLKSHAPNFYEGFFNYLERKPEVKKLYEQIQDDIRGGNIDKNLSKRIYQMFRKGDKAYGLALDKDLRIKDGLMREFVDANWMIIKKIKRVGESNIPAGQNPRYKLEDMAYSGAELEWLIMKAWREALKPLEKQSLEWDDFGFDLFLRRVTIGDRGVKSLAQPLGLTEKRAQKLLDERYENRTPAQRTAVEDSIKSFGEMNQYIIDKGKKEKMWDPELVKEMEENKQYATFDVIKYIEKRNGTGPTAKMFPQIGTLQEISNPATATLLKNLAIIKAINRKIAAESVVSFMERHFPGEIIEADKRWNGKFHELKNPADPNLGMIAYLEKGKAKGYYVDKWIADMFKTNPLEGNAVVKILRGIANPFRMVFTELNFGFWAFNLQRDYFRLVTNLPKAKMLKFIPTYLESIKPAARSVFGIPDSVIEELQKGKMLISIADYRGESKQDAEIERLLKRYHFSKASWDNRILRPFGQFFTWYTNVGRVIERIPKVGAYKYLKKNFPDMEPDLLAHLVRNAGSPDFLRKGKFHPLYNNMFLFSNAMKEGNRGDYAAFGRNPGDFAWKKTKYIFIPKVLMYAAAMGLLGAGTKAIMDGVGEFDKSNYTIIPLGLTDNGKSVYLRVPTDESGRLLGGIFWKLMTRETKNWETGLFDYMAGQAPTLSPGLDMIIDTVDYASGKIPYDSFRGRYAYSEQIHEAGGVEEAKAFARWLANKSGATIVHRFRYDDLEHIQTELEKMIGWPFASNIIGRFIKVSNRGLREKNELATVDIKQANAKALIAAKKAIIKIANGEKLSDKEIIAIAGKIDMFDRNLVLTMTRKGGDIFVQDILTADSNEEAQAIFEQYQLRQALLDEAMPLPPLDKEKPKNPKLNQTITGRSP